MKKSIFILASVVALLYLSSCKFELFPPTPILAEVSGSWIGISPNTHVDSIIATSTGLIAFSNTQNQPALYSADHGTTWSALGASPINHPYWIMADVSNNSKIFTYCALDSTLYLSTNGGQSFTPINQTTDSTILAVGWVSGNRLFAQIFNYVYPYDSPNVASITEKYYLLKSDNFGNTWDTIFRYTFPFQLFGDTQLLALRSIRGSLFMFTGNEIYKSVDNGATFTSINSVVPTGGQYVGVLSNGNVIGYGNSSFYQSTDSCRTWLPVLNMSISGQNGSMAFDSCVFVISNYGNKNLICGSPTTGKWMAADANIPASTFQGYPNSALTFDNQYIYLTISSTIYRRARSDFAGI
jgi:hypothetical protein